MVKNLVDYVYIAVRGFYGTLAPFTGLLLRWFYLYLVSRSLTNTHYAFYVSISVSSRSMMGNDSLQFGFFFRLQYSSTVRQVKPQKQHWLGQKR